MRIKTLELENIRSYDTETVEFAEGANLIYGKNGAGKSSILQGIFGGLFQTSMTDQLGAEFTLDKLVNKNADEGRIELTFEVDGIDYTVEWVITVSEDEDGERSANTKPGYPTLTAEVYDEPITGVRSVGPEIQDVVGMDAESFVNSVYVQQGDITRLIHADTDDRREILDGLLGLNRLDELIERMDEARLEFGKAKRDARTLRQDSENRLEDMPAEDDVQERIEGLQAEISEVQSDIEDKRETLEGLREGKRERESKLESIEETEDELNNVRERLETAREERDSHVETIKSERKAKKQTEADLSDAEDTLTDALDAAKSAAANLDEAYDLADAEAAEEALSTAQTAAEEARSALQSLQEGELQTAQTELQHLEQQRDEKQNERDEKQEELEGARDLLGDAEKRVDEAEDKVDRLEEDLADKRAAVRETAAGLDLPGDASLDEYRDTHIPEAKSEVSEQKEEVREEIGRLNTLTDQVDDLTDGECPLCGATEESHEHDFDDRADELDGELTDAQERLTALSERDENLDALADDVNDAITLRDDDLDDARDAVEDAREKVKDLNERIDDRKEAVAEREEAIESLEADIEGKQAEIEDIEGRIEDAERTVEAREALEEAIDDVVDAYDRIDELESDIDDHETTIEHAQELRQQKQDTIRDLEQRESDLEAELEDTDPEDLREEIKEIENQHIPKYEQEIEKAEKREDELRGDIAEANQQLQSIQDEKERRDSLEEQVTWAANREEEAEDVKNTYKDVRSTLRADSLARLQKYTNEVFADLYQHQSYRGVKIDENYNIELQGTTGADLEPELSSGGEGCILNLALRAGVYRIIAERDGVAGAALPPFILDEPSTHLDGDHVGELQSMIDTINEWDVPQVLVVDHDDQLIQNADTALHVEKDPATEASRVQQDATYHSSGPAAAGDD